MWEVSADTGLGPGHCFQTSHSHTTGPMHYQTERFPIEELQEVPGDGAVCVQRCIEMWAFSPGLTALLSTF